jgi:anti-anti-sigma regulatory factor
MLRINKRDCECGERLELEGRLTGTDVPELEKVVAQARGRSSRVTLDLSELIFLDRNGVRLLREFQSQQVGIHGCSAFVAELLGLR